MKASYIFREITNKNELESFFRLRYEVYSDTVLVACLKENKDRIDINHFDVHSRHFGFFQGDHVAGYLRVVFPKDEITNYNVLQIGKQYGLLDEMDYFHKNGKAPFPFLSYKNVPQSHWDFYNEISQKNERIAEASRLVLCVGHRSLRTSRFLIECAMALFVIICIGKKHAMVDCKCGHGFFYENYGFKKITEGEPYFQIGTNRKTEDLTLPFAETLSTSLVPKHHHAKLEQMAEEFSTTGKIEREL